MKWFVLIALFISFLASPISASAQTDECRQLSGMPIPIGTPVICGQVKLVGLRTGEARPAIDVNLVVGGVQADRMRTNDSGFYYFLKSPGNNTQLVFEVNNTEVGRVQLTAGLGSNSRRDIEVDMNTVRGVNALASPGVVSVQNAYKRTAAAEQEFDRAMSIAKSKQFDDAVAAFRTITEKDPRDFVAWTELGTVQFSASKLSDAEKSYNQALVLKPDFMPALMNLGKLHMAEKKFDKSAVVFYKAVTADPGSADAFHYLGESFLQTKEGSKAVVALNEAIRLEPVAKAEIHLRLATLYNGAGAKDRAANEYKLFLSKQPSYRDREKLEKYIKENAKP